MKDASPARNNSWRVASRVLVGGAAKETGIAPELRVKMKVAPHMVRVKYKTTRCSGVDVDTP